MSDIFEQWTTECPKCHNRDCLKVFEVTLVRTGKVITQDNALCPDGFEVDSNDRDCSTENEKVCCDKCGEIFALQDLAIK